MNEISKKRISKFLSLVLRHSPEKIGLGLDINGWANIDELIFKAGNKNVLFTKDELKEVVITNDKQRFVFNDEITKIRASQGHSIEVELDLQKQQPPEFLYHGTVEKFLEEIKLCGLQKMSRQHVHLSFDKLTAEKVGNRRGKAVILKVASRAMEKDGFLFYVSANGVWLTDHVPTKYIRLEH